MDSPDRHAASGRRLLAALAKETIAVPAAVVAAMVIFIFAFIRGWSQPVPGAYMGAIVIAAIQVVAMLALAALFIPRERQRRYGWLIFSMAILAIIIVAVGAVTRPDSGLSTLLRSPVFIFIALAISLFDTGRPSTWIDRWITLPGSALALVLYAGVILVAPALPGGVVGLDCGAACAPHFVNAWEEPAVASVLSTMYMFVRAGVMVACAIAVWQRISRTRGASRAALWPIAWGGTAWAVAGVVGTVIDVAAPNGAAAGALVPLVFIGRLAGPLGIVIGVVISERRRGGSFERDFSVIRTSDSAADVQRNLRTLLEDDALEVVLPGDPAPESGGEPVELRSADGRLVATIVHRPGLRADQPLVYAIALPAATQALEQVDLSRQVAALEADLQAARTNALAAGMDERQRIERDLHDGAQLRLILLRGRLERLADETATANSVSRADIDALLADADSLLADVRSITAGMRRVEPGRLGDAVRDLAANAPRAKVASADGLSGLDPIVEQMVFYCVSECLQNALKHAGAHASVLITLERNGDQVIFTVVDDGVGISGESGGGSGLVGIRERLTMLGGGLELVSMPGVSGVAVRGWLPALAAVRTDSA